MTLPDSFCRISFAMAKESRTPSGTGRKERDSADARNASRSFPPSFATARESSSSAHIRIWTRGEPSSGSSNCSPPHEFLTTGHGYPADGVVWIRIAPTAPFLAAIRYL